MADLFDFFGNIAYNSSMKIKNINMRIYSMEIKPQYFGAVITSNMVTEKELKRIKKKAVLLKAQHEKQRVLKTHVGVKLDNDN